MIYKSYQSNITRKRIFLLSIPVFFSNIAIPLVGLVDIGLMGNLGEAKYLAAISVATSVMTLIIWSFGFLRMGTVGIIAELYGKSDYREIARTIIRNILIAIFVSVIIIFIKPIILEFVKKYFLVSTETYELIKTYISVRVLSVPAELIIYILIGFFLGIQRTKISSFFIIIFSALNIVISSFLSQTLAASLKVLVAKMINLKYLFHLGRLIC